MKFWGWTLRITIIALGVGLFMLQSQFAKKSILDWVTNQPLQNSSFRIETGDIRGLFPFQFTVGFLDLKDGDQTVTRLSDIWATWSVPDLVKQEVKIYIRKGEELAGNITYVLGQHAVFSDLKGRGVPLGKEASLQSLKIDLPSLTLLKGQISAVITDRHNPVTLTATLEEVDEERLEIPKITVTGKEIRGKGRASVFPKQGLWEGKGDMELTSLAVCDRWLQESVTGTALLTGQKSLTGEANLHLVLKSFHYNRVKAGDLDIQATLSEKGSGRVTARGQGIQVNDIFLSNLSATGTLDDKTGNFGVTGTGPGKIVFHTQGTVTLPTLPGSPTQITLAKAELAHPLHQFSLKQPTFLTWAGKGIQTKKLWLATGQGNITLQDLAIGETLSGTVVIDKLPLTLLQMVHAEWVASGFLSGKGTLGGTWENPDITLSLEGKSIQRGTPKTPDSQGKKQFPGVDVSGHFGLSQGILSWKTSVMTRHFLRLSSDGEIPVAGWQPLRDSPLKTVVQGTGDLSALSLFIPDISLSQGQASANLSITGTLNNPVVQGQVSLTNGLYEDGVSGTVIRKIHIEGKASGNTLTLSRITGKDNAKGHIHGQGTFRFTSLFNPEVAIQLVLDQFIIVQNDDLFGKVKGILKMNGELWAGNQAKAKITGDLTLIPLEVSLDEPDKKIASIKLQEKQADGSYQTVLKSLKKRTLQQGPFSFPLEITLKSPGEIYLRGQGFESQWKGEIQVIGPLTDPQLIGNINLLHGQFILLGKPLKLTEGSIHYQQTPANDPLLSIIGTRPVGDITAIMRIEGYASHPKITFSSNPALPQEEVLARLLFGKGLEHMSVTQSLLLANALSTFKGKNSLNVTEKIKAAFGLDVLEFKEKQPTDDDDLKSATQQVSVGKQISDKVYLSLDKSVSGEGGANATIQVDVTPSLKIEADVGGDKNTGVGFAWIKKY